MVVEKLEREHAADVLPAVFAENKECAVDRVTTMSALK